MDKRHFRKMQITQKVRKTPENQRFSGVFELRGKDLNQRPPGYEFKRKCILLFNNFGKPLDFQCFPRLLVFCRHLLGLSFLYRS